jgi:phenylacetate-CoA ligase
MARYLAYASLQRTQWLDRDRLRALQERKLRRLVAHAYQSVPYYRQLFERVGLSPAAVVTLEDLNKIPISSKEEFQRAGRAQLTSRHYRSKPLHLERTSGSTGRPFEVAYDREFLGYRNGLFLRALTAVGYRPGMRLMLVTTGRENAIRRLLRWRYVAIDASPATLLRLHNTFRPHVVYGAVSPLRGLVRHAHEVASGLHRPVSVVTSGESLDPLARNVLARGFGSVPYETYGLTETGVLGWECSERAGMHISEDMAIVECLPARGAGEPERIVVTNLGLWAMPLLRFETGDLGVLGPDERCTCGRYSRRLLRIEGRSVDLLHLPAGRVVSPYRLTLAIEAIPGVTRYQVVQEEPLGFTIRLAVAEALGHVAGLRVRVEPTPRLDAVPGRKFRVVESLVTRTAEREDTGGAE